MPSQRRISRAWLVAAVLAISIGAVYLPALNTPLTEAVIYATQRTELMMALFYLATLYCGLRYWASSNLRTQRATWLTLATLACLAGMASKEVMVSAWPKRMPTVKPLPSLPKQFGSHQRTSITTIIWPSYLCRPDAMKTP
jgi:hypothetical protein